MVGCMRRPDRGVRELAEAILRESGNDLFALWETCQALQELAGHRQSRIDISGAPPDWRTKTVERFRGELQRLSRFEFMDTIRMFEVARDAERVDEAEELLLRAGAAGRGRLRARRRRHPATDVRCQRPSGAWWTRWGGSDGHACSAGTVRSGWSSRASCCGSRTSGAHGRSSWRRRSSTRPRLSPIASSSSRSNAPSFLDAGQRAQLVQRAGQRLVDDDEAGRLGPYPAPTRVG